MEDNAADDKMIEDDGAETSFYDSLLDHFQSLAVEDGRTIEVDMESAAAAATTAEEEWEQLLIAIREHVHMYWAQLVLYQEKEEEAIVDAKEDKPLPDHRYTFLVDYRQNMELPVYTSQQPGAMYY